MTQSLRFLMTIWNLIWIWICTLFLQPSLLVACLFLCQHMSYRGAQTLDLSVTGLWLVRTTVWGWPYPSSVSWVTHYLESNLSPVCMESAETGITPYLAAKVSASYKHNKSCSLFFYRELNIWSEVASHNIWDGHICCFLCSKVKITTLSPLPIKNKDFS